MEYSEVSERLLVAFPELKVPFQELKAAYGGDEPGQYIVLEDLLGAMVEHLFLAAAEPTARARLDDVFDFVEELLGAGGEVETLGALGMLYGRSDPWLKLAEPHLGTRSLAYLDEHFSGWRERAAEAGGAIEPPTDAYHVGRELERWRSP